MGACKPLSAKNQQKIVCTGNFTKNKNSERSWNSHHASKNIELTPGPGDGQSGTRVV